MSFENIFSLIGKHGDNVKAEKEIKETIKLFVLRIGEIHSRYPEGGIGDTSTDETIVAEIYEEIHKL